MSLHVVITGGGIGGLCLAQVLRMAGISATVCERDQSAGFRHQGYRISLKPAGAGALHECLPANLFDLAVATSIPGGGTDGVPGRTAIPEVREAAAP